jgi:hypothetical protein
MKLLHPFDPLSAGSLGGKMFKLRELGYSDSIREEG